MATFGSGSNADGVNAGTFSSWRRFSYAFWTWGGSMNGARASVAISPDSVSNDRPTRVANNARASTPSADSGLTSGLGRASSSCATDSTTRQCSDVVL